MKIAILFISIISHQYLTSQLNIDPQLYDAKNKFYSSINETDVEYYLTKLKKSTTYFVYKESDSIEKFMDTLQSVWTLSKLKFITFEEYKNIENDSIWTPTKIKFIPFEESKIKEDQIEESVSFISLESLYYETKHTKVEDGKMIYKNGKYVYPNNKSVYIFGSDPVKTKEYSYLNFRLWMKEGDKKVVFFDLPVYLTITSNAEVRKEKPDQAYYYSKAQYYNYEIGYLKNILQAANLELGEKKEISTTSSIMHLRSEINKLENDTLYIPDYALINRYPEGIKDLNNIKTDKIKKVYSYPIKIVSKEEISDLILNNIPIYYLNVICDFNKNTYVNITNSLTSEIIYKHTTVSNEMKLKSLSKLSKQIKAIR